MATVAQPRTAAQPAENTWKAAHYLAVIGVALLAVQLYVWIAWLADGPTQQTEFRSYGSASWYAARIGEGIAIALVLGVGTWVVRGCIAARRLTFDAKFCIAGLLTYWLDPTANFAQPIFIYSQNWVNVTDWVHYIPLHQRTVPMIEAPLFVAPMYACGFLVIATIVNWVMRTARRLRPTLSTARLIGVTVAAAIVMDILFEWPFYLLHLWAFTGAPDELSIFSGASRFPWAEWLVIGIFLFAPLAMMRYFVNDRGERLVERGLDKLRPGWQTPVSLLAMVGFFNLLLITCSILQVNIATYSDPYPDLPADVISRTCDVPGEPASTAYGPCPGSPGYRLPLSETNPEIVSP